jgi:hypothetical protein
MFWKVQNVIREESNGAIAPFPLFMRFKAWQLQVAVPGPGE